MANGNARSQIVAMHRLFLSLTALSIGIVVVGFWPSYFGPLIRGVVDRPDFIHFHAMVFSGWMALFVAQVVLASTGRIATHRKVGNIGIAYGIGIFFVGVFTAIAMFDLRVEAGEIEQARRQVLAPLTDMIVFPIFFGAAIYYRRKPEMHKRLMLVATNVLLIAAALRLRAFGDPLPFALRIAIWVSPVMLAMAYDYFTRRLIHPAYVVGLIGLLILSQRGRLQGTAFWDVISGWLVTVVS